MSTFALPFQNSSPPKARFDIGSATRAMVLVVGGAMSAVCFFAIMRALFGFAPELPHLKNVAVTLHVITVLPCVPLGMYLLLAKKGTPAHKQLGKLWVALMVITATSTIFIYDGMQFSWIHIFVPITYRAAWLIVTSARAGDMEKHKKEIVSLFFGGLMIPGIAAFVIPGRLMGTMLFG